MRGLDSSTFPLIRCSVLITMWFEQEVPGAAAAAAAAPSAVWSDSALDPVESSQRAMLEAKARYERRLPSG
jgi:hypothetical protein